MSFEKCLQDLDNLDEKGDIEGVATLRKHIVDTYLPSVSFWQSWFTDATIKGDLTEVGQLFDLVGKFCPHQDIVTEHVEFMVAKYESEDIDEDLVRSTMEKCIALIGYDVYESMSIWRAYRLFEIDEHAEFEKNSEEELDAKKRVISLFRRQLSLPLFGNRGVLEDFQEWLGIHCTDEDMRIIDPHGLNEKYEKALESYDARIAFEEALKSEKHSNASLEGKFSTWKAYAQFEVNDNQIARAQRIYERASMEIGQYEKFWEEFLVFAVHTVKLSPLVESVSDRARRVCSGNVRVMKTWLISLERAKVDFSTFKQAVQRALAGKFELADCYLEILLIQCDFIRRRVSQQDESQLYDCITGVSELRTAFDIAEAFLARSYPDWLQGWIHLLSYRADTEDKVVERIVQIIGAPDDEGSPECGSLNVSLPTVSSQTQEVWERLVSKFSNQAIVWLRYISWLTTNGHIELSRKLFKKALNKIGSDQSVEIAREFVNFERRHGNLDEYEVADARYQQAMSMIVNAQGINNSIDKALMKTSTVTDHKGDKFGDGKKRQFADTEQIANSTEPNITKKSKIDDTVVISKPVSAAKVSAVAVHKSLEEGDSTVENKSKSTVYVKNLSFNTTENDIRSHFCACGQIRSLDLVTSREGKSRGMVTIEFFTPLMAKAAIERFHRTVFMDRELIVEELEVGNGNVHPTTVFVSKLPRDFTSEMLHGLFISCGDIVEARVVVDKISGKGKGHGLVQFKDISSMTAAFAMNKTKIGDSTISVLKSKFPAEVTRVTVKSEVTLVAEKGSQYQKSNMPSSSPTASTANISSVKAKSTASTIFKPRSLLPRTGK